jgi:hypothetical protein
MFGGREPLLYFGAELVHRDAGKGGGENLLKVLYREFGHCLPVAGENTLERLDVFESRFFSTSDGTRSRQYITCVYIGCST